MNKSLNDVNQLFTEIFSDILKIEEDTLKKGPFNDISVTEMHTVAAIGMYVPRAMSDVAKKLDITVGTLTVAINNLVKKGYVTRTKSEIDKRVVMLTLTKRGRLLFRAHQKFHSDIIKNAVICLSEQEAEIFSDAVTKVCNFFSEQYSKIKQGEAYV